ncbi:MAG TPA: ribose 5-phosphate isomerase B [Planctomycetota bacterium]|nr:ribose 5-phosphate isomerase B [Planctomycetota bacterium]
MKIAVGADHAGFATKEHVKAALVRAGHEVHDCGTQGEASVDYPDYARLVAQAVAEGRAERGVLVCGTGIGMSITANKVDGIRAAKCNDPYEARMARAHNDANVVCVGARVIDASVLDEVVREFIATLFEGGRHARRVEKMMRESPSQDACGS